MIEENFSKAKLESAVASNYDSKVSKNNARRKFIDAYVNSLGKLNDELLEAARICIMTEKGIVVESAPDYKVDITEETLNNLYLGIKNRADDNFRYFFESYQRKIERGYDNEHILSALQDLKTAYHTFRKCSILDWECPDEIVNLIEMENLYTILAGKPISPKLEAEKSIND